MKTFRELDKLEQYLCENVEEDRIITIYRTVLEDNKETIGLLRLLEKVNPCGQEYHLHQGIILVSYVHNLNLLNFTKRFSLKAKVRIIGLPVSLSLGGVLSMRVSNVIEEEAHKRAVGEVLRELEGLTLVLNSDFDLTSGSRTLSAFVFHNHFPDFQAYLDALRAPYRRTICRALDKGQNLEFISIPSKDFTKDHYALYLSVMERTQNPLETLPIRFFREYEADIVEVRNEHSELVGFIQLKSVDTILYFMFCGFHKDKVGNENPHDSSPSHGREKGRGLKSIDLYFNMLLHIIGYGIENGYERIEMGQTSEETKLKLGCVEVDKYLCLHHEHALVNWFLQKLSARLSYKGYQTTHHVFKTDHRMTGTSVENTENVREKEIG